MTKIKLCGLTRPCDIAAANELMPEYIGLVFAKKSRRYVTPQAAAELKRQLHRDITAVGVFVDSPPEEIAELLDSGVIEAAQLHGGEGEKDIAKLRILTKKPIIQAFTIKTEADINRAEQSSADCILLDSGAGTGAAFDWDLIKSVSRPYFLAGGLSASNVSAAVERLHPYAVDVSSGIETDGFKDRFKMAEFTAAVRKGARL